MYVAWNVGPQDLPAAVAGVRALGVAGVNVTMPHKAAAAGLVDRLSPDAEALDAVNTLVRVGDRIEGHNTDAPGFARFLADDAAFRATGRSALLLGAGGAGRACALALARDGLSTLRVGVRSPDSAGRIRELAERLDLPIEVLPISRAVEEAPTSDLVVSAVPPGVLGSAVPFPSFRPGQLVVDLVYRPAVTPLERAAREAGATAFSGLGMLLHQAALSFALWTGREAPLEVMSAAATAELATEPAPPPPVRLPRP